MKKPAFFVLLVMMGTTGLSQSVDEQMLFRIDKRNVPVAEFIYLYEKNHKGRPEEFTRAKVEEYLDLYIKFKLKVEEARLRGMDTTAKFQKEYLGYKEALRKPYLPDNSLVDSLTRLTYERMQTEVKASHILVRLAPDAGPADTLAAYNKITAIRKRIEAGEDFGSVAVSVSEDASAKSNEGNLGYFTALQMVYPFESGAYNTPVGRVSDPVRTRFGYHLIKVADKRPASGEVEVSHVLIRVGKDRDTDQARRQIFEIYDRLQGGMKWEELCKQYSEDPSSKDNGGKLRPFGVGAMAAVPQFEKAAFALTTPGEYTAPLLTQYGWHIVRLEKKIPLPTYKELESTLKNRVSRDERMQTAKNAIQRNLRAKYQLVENQEVLAQVMALADSSLVKGTWRKPTAGVSQSTLITVKDTPSPASKFFDYAAANQKPSRLAPTAYMKQLYELFVDASIQEAVENELMATSADYRYLSNEYYEGILLFDIMEREVWNRASEDSVGQAAYFSANSNRYHALERAEATVYSGKKAALDELQRLLPDSAAAAECIQKNGLRADRGKFEKKDRPVMNAIPWTPGLHPAQVDGNAYLVRVDRILPAGPRTLDEARGLLISDFQNHLEAEWIKTLRSKHSVKVNGKAKKYVLEKLVPTKG